MVLYAVCLSSLIQSIHNGQVNLIFFFFATYQSDTFTEQIKAFIHLYRHVIDGKCVRPSFRIQCVQRSHTGNRTNTRYYTYIRRRTMNQTHLQVLTIWPRCRWRDTARRYNHANIKILYEIRAPYTRPSIIIVARKIYTQYACKTRAAIMTRTINNNK